jgi:SRSO17 transposase
MTDDLDTLAQRRLEAYLDGIGELLGTDHARASFATYATGLLGPSERKSVEPIAALACADPARVDALHQSLLHFLNNVAWDDRAVRLFAARHALAAMGSPVRAWIVDDTGFLKQGKHSVGVQRQYTGSAGKVTNCQVATSLVVATRSQHVPIDFELYLPQSWASDENRRREARIPDGVPFRTKPQMALAMLRRAVDDGIPPGVVLGDTGYGDSSDFRAGVRALGLHYAVGVGPLTKVFRIDEGGKRADHAFDVRTLSTINRVCDRFRRVTWREGTCHRLSARFSVERVVPAHDDGTPIDDREPVWLVCEWRDGEAAPTKFHFVSLPSLPSRRALIEIIKERWRTERVYEDLKGELGLDHFEGRRFTGWHHHVSVALACFAFLVAEQARAIPPSSPWMPTTYPLAHAA